MTKTLIPLLLLLLLFAQPAASQIPLGQPGFELEYMLHMVDQSGQLRFDTITGSGPVQIADLLRDGAEITDTAHYDLFLYAKDRGFLCRAAWPETTEIWPSGEGYYRLEVKEREGRVERQSQFYYRLWAGGWWRVIYLASSTQP